jgi:uncharacterized protein YodC (DUF2158 family)
MPITIGPGISVGPGITMQSFVPVGSAVFSSASAKYLTAPANAGFNFGTDNFTLELWVYPTNLAAGTGDVLVLENGSAYMIIGQGNTDGRVRANWNDTPTTGSPFNSITSASGTLAQNSWQHICTMRSGTSYSLFINGVCRASATSAGIGTAQMGSSALPWTIGSDSGSNRFNGNISNIRIVKGSLVYAFGTTVGTTYFTPPTTNLTAITNTQLLLNTPNDENFLKDSSTNNLTIVNTGSVVSSPLNPFI